MVEMVQKRRMTLSEQGRANKGGTGGRAGMPTRGPAISLAISVSTPQASVLNVRRSVWEKANYRI